jgi:hypothetical protein
MPEELYIGYRRTAPSGTARFVRRLLLALGALAVGLSAGLATSQQPFDPGSFEYGVERSFVGLLIEMPYPLLAVEDGSSPPRLHLLVAPGKHGAAALVVGLDGRRVRLAGSLVERSGNAMIEVVPDSIVAETAAAGPAPARHLLGRLAVRGEIVDGKCFLGVMKPGRDKPHRDCAARCLAGGVPPLLWVPGGKAGYIFLLVDERGRALGAETGDWVGEPVAIDGRVERLGDLLVLAADPGTWRRRPRR